jgi:hypothetical protein
LRIAGKKNNESLTNDSSFIFVLSIKAAVEMLFMNNGALHDEIDTTFIIYLNRLVWNEHSYESIKTYFS